MPITMQERFERAKQHQKDIAEGRLDKRTKSQLPSYKGKTEQKHEMIWKQLGLCAICGKDIREGAKLVHIDHCHETGAIRGILCHNCNVGLGHFKDSVDRLQSAIDYLEEFRTEHAQLKNKQKQPKVIVKNNDWNTPREIVPFKKPDNWYYLVPEIMIIDKVL